jgi:hypothetical protein
VSEARKKREVAEAVRSERRAHRSDNKVRLTKGVRVHLATIPSDLTGGKEAGVYQVDPWGGRRDHAWKVGSLHFVERKANRDDDTEGSGGQGSEFAAGDAS